jgi:hypothetical protein
VTARSFRALALVALFAGCASRREGGASSADNDPGSSATPEPGTGMVRLALGPAPRLLTIPTVHWQIVSSASIVLRQGDIDTSDPNATPSVDTSCPASNGDKVVMTATATDGTVCTGTSPPFNVIAGGTVMVGVVLVCGGAPFVQGGGSVLVGGEVVAGDSCPQLTSWSASPLQVLPGGTVDVAATATDADPGDTLSYVWTASAGSFANPAAPATQFLCTPAGPAILTVTVSDNHSPTPCTTAVSLAVSCSAD